MKNWDFTELQSLGLVLVIGLGQTGVAATKWCVANGLNVRVADTRENPPSIDQLQKYQNNPLVQLYLGLQKLEADIIDGVDTIIVSPGVSINDPLISPLLQMAKVQKINVIGEIELFALSINILKKQGYQPKVLAVTGTNGKTTVTDMTQQIIADNGYSVIAAGNISPCATHALQQALENNDLPDVWLLELSSFQLVTTTSLQVDCATILNISQDHLDWHGNYEEYIKAKLRLLQMAQRWALNRDDTELNQFIEKFVNLPNDINHKSKGNGNKPSNSFGSDKPIAMGDLGIEILNDMPWFCYADDNGSTTNLMPVNAMLLRGTHNALNAQCAMLLANNMGIQLNNCLATVRSYLGQSHRMEFVNNIDGVSFINDSKGTNVGASVAALHGMDNAVILIAGGLAKGQDFSALALAIKEKAKRVILIGKDAEQIEALIKGVCEYDYADSIDEAVNLAFSKAKQGDTVLLSPACASMDMFENYGQRGDSFKNSVMQLAIQKGQVM